ncbi:MAG: aldose epimerase [Chitinophagaceae bacterium]|nr:aldose epimerase [Chitinophagaceae bacterium]
MVYLKNDFLEVEIDTKGAEVKRIYHRQFQLDYLWNGDAAYWNRSSPVLFPIVGKVKDNTYTYKDQPYHLTQHGFARDTDFILESSTATAAVFTLSSNPKTLAVYPFEFKLYITYTLSEARLTVAYKVMHSEEGELLFSIGAHPGFLCPLEAGLSFEDYQLTFEKEENTPRLLLGSSGVSRKTETVFVSDSNVIPLDYNLFGAKDAIIFKDLQSTFMTLSSSKGSHGLHFHFTGFPYMGIWTKPGPFLCIEPWFGIADFEDANGKLEHKEGIIRLSSGKAFQAAYSMEFF